MRNNLMPLLAFLVCTLTPIALIYFFTIVLPLILIDLINIFKNG